MSMNSSLKAALTRVVSSPVLWDAPLMAWTTFRIGGPADALVTLLDGKEIQEVIGLCEDEKVVWKLIGRGSNIVASDHGFSGVVIVLGDSFKYIVRGDYLGNGTVIVRCGAAVSLTRLTDWCAEESLAGLEFAAGIPGSIGGAVVMNAGAWGTEISEILYSVELVDSQRTATLVRKDLSFKYRCCENFSGSHRNSVITAVQLVLKQSKSAEIRAEMKKLRQKRLSKQPSGMPTAGSFFKNPPGASAGKLIEASGMKGFSVGDAEVSEKHANFFVNRGKATAADVIELMRVVQEQVKKTSGVVLETEVQFL